VDEERGLVLSVIGFDHYWEEQKHHLAVQDVQRLAG
jgi:hypothetical protein